MKVPVPMIILVLLAVALYVAATALGWGPEGGLEGCAPSAARKQELRSSSLLRGTPVKSAELRLDGCVRIGNLLRFAGACTLTVDALDTWFGTRSLALRPATPFGVKFQPSGEDAVAIDANAQVNKVLDLTIPKEGAVVALACMGGAADGCSATVE